VAQAVNALDNWLIVLLPSTTGIMLGLFLPWLAVPREHRRWPDWCWGAGVGAAAGLSIYGSIGLYYAWCRSRRWDEVCGRLSADDAVLFWTVGMCLVLGAFFLAVAPEMAAIAAVLASVFLLWGSIRLIWVKAGKRRGATFLLFVTANVVADLAVCYGLRAWLSLYR
jgi:hypothetical protein